MKRKYIFWLILTLPALLLIGTDYGYALSRSGVTAAVFVLATLAAPHVRRWFPGLMCHRRAIGVAAFGYSALHLTIYLSRKWPEALDAATGQDLLTGWIAFVIYAALAVTSRDKAVRAMGPRWKRLHKLTWAASALLAAHWVLSAFDPLVGWLFAGAVAGLWLLGRVRRRRA